MRHNNHISKRVFFAFFWLSDLFCRGHTEHYLKSISSFTPLCSTQNFPCCHNFETLILQDQRRPQPDIWGYDQHERLKNASCGDFHFRWCFYSANGVLWKKNTLILRYLLRRNCLLDHMFCSHFCNVLYLSCYLTLWTSDFDFVFVFVTQGLSAEVVGDVDDCGCGPGDNEIARAVHWNNQRKWYLHCRSNPPVHYTVPQSPTVHSATTTYQCISAFLQSYQHFCHYRLINGNNGKNFRNLLLYPWIWDL